MAQNPSDVKAARDLARKYGRVNWGEYSKLTGTPIPKNAVPVTVKEPPQVVEARRNAKRFGRVNAAEYARLTAKKPRRKAASRKRIPTK
jgi:cell division protein FtsX